MKVNGKVSKQSKCRRCFKAIIGAIAKAQEFYVNGMSELARHAEFGCPPTAAHISTLPKSFSVSSTTRSSSSDQDFSELIRVASKRGLARKAEYEFLKQQRDPQITTTMNVVQHSRSVGMGRIDEDKACDFDGDDAMNYSVVNFPRSRSHVVSTRRNGMF